MTTCWFCGGRMIWGGDHTREDYGMDGEGIVANLHCSSCNAMALFTNEIEENTSDSNKEEKEEKK